MHIKHLIIRNTCKVRNVSARHFTLTENIVLADLGFHRSRVSSMQQQEFWLFLVRGWHGTKVEGGPALDLFRPGMLHIMLSLPVSLFIYQVVFGFVFLC